jgi:hypothetical protein
MDLDVRIFLDVEDDQRTGRRGSIEAAQTNLTVIIIARLRGRCGRR